VLVHVDGAGSASVDKNGVLGGRVTRRSLLPGTLGGRALNIDRVLLLLRECGHNEIRRYGGVDGHDA